MSPPGVARVFSIDPNVVFVNRSSSRSHYVDLTFNRIERSDSAAGGAALPLPNFVRFSADQQVPVYYTDLGTAVVQAEQLADGSYCVDGISFQVVCDDSCLPLQENELIWMDEEEDNELIGGI